MTEPVVQAIRDEAALRQIYPEPVDLIKRKVLARLDSHALQFLELASLAFVSTAAPDGTCDVSPRGDQAGFMRVLSLSRIAFPDWPGNNRIDSLRNIIAHPGIGLVMVVPGHHDCLRINGRAFVTVDPDLLRNMQVERRMPRSAVVVDITEVYFHCGRAFRRSDAWNPARYPAPGVLPTLARIIADQTRPDAGEKTMLDRSDNDPLY